MSEPLFIVHGPARALHPLVLDSPHSGYAMPADFGAALSAHDLREGEDCFIDQLYLPATAKGIPLLAAMFPRTYLDVNRHAADIDPELLAQAWPEPVVASGKARIGKALIWRTLDDGRAIYARKLSLAEVRGRIVRCHQPYHDALRQLLAAAHEDFGVVYHLNCHSMNAVSGVMAEGGAGQHRADFVLGDRHGTSCAPAFTAFVRERLEGFGYDVKINHPFAGVELVRAFANPASGRHSLQLEINKRLYMNETRREIIDHFRLLQQQLMQLLDAICHEFQPRHA